MACAMLVLTTTSFAYANDETYVMPNDVTATFNFDTPNKLSVKFSKPFTDAGESVYVVLDIKTGQPVIAAKDTAESLMTDHDFTGMIFFAGYDQVEIKFQNIPATKAELKKSVPMLLQIFLMFYEDPGTNDPGL